MSNSDRNSMFGSRLGAAATSRRDREAGVGDTDRTSPATQIAQDSDDYLGETALDVGRKTSASEYELFVSCNPAPAMQQQFEHLRPEFISVHDVGTTSSLRLLSGLASATGVATQKLVIRRQGYGTALATIHFVELPSAGGTKLRMYSTDCETEPSWRQSLAHMLLAFSRLGVIMVGDLKTADLATVLTRLRDSIVRGPWHNEQMLLLPLGSASSLVNHGMELARDTAVNVRTTPQVARAADAWGFISGTWNRLTERDPKAQGTVAALAKLVAAAGPRPAPAGGPGEPVAPAASEPVPVKAAAAAPRQVANAPASRHEPAFAATQHASDELDLPIPARPAVAVASATVSQPATADLLRRYVRQISELTGVVGCTVFDAANGNRVAYAGTGPSAGDLAAQGAALLKAILTSSSTLKLGRVLPEAAITLESHHLLLRAVPRHHGLALHAVLDKAKANLTLVRLQVLRLDGMFEEPVSTTDY